MPVNILYHERNIPMLKEENRVDKQRFEEKKDEEQSCGCGEHQAIQQSAREVKEERKEEGRSKDPDAV
jgi:hypothetical protein